MTTPVHHLAKTIRSELAASLDGVPSCMLCHVSPTHNEGIVSVTIGGGSTPSRTLTFLLGDKIVPTAKSCDDNPYHEVHIVQDDVTADHIDAVVTEWLARKPRP